MRRLFDTERFQHVEAWLAEQRRAQEAAVQAGRRRLRDLASKAEQAAGPQGEPVAAWVPAEDEPAHAAAGLTAGVLGWAAILRSGAAEQLAVADAALAVAEAGHGEAQLALARAEELAGRQRRHRAAAQEAARLTGNGPAVEHERRRLADAQAALGVESVLHLRRAAAEAQRAAGAEEHRRREALAGLPGEGAALARAGAGEAAGAEQRLRAETVRLEAARADEQRCELLGRELASLDTDRRRAEELAEEAADWLAEFDGRIAALQEEQTAARAAGSLVERLDARRGELAARLAAARSRDALGAEIAAAEPHVLARRAEALDAREHSQDVRERRLTGMAAELARQLRSGEACRVCGSPDHPEPARPAGRQVGADDERRAQQAQAVAERALEEAERELAGLRVREAAAAGAAGPDAAEALAGSLAALERERREALRAAESLDAVGRQIERLTGDQNGRLAELRDAGERTAVLTERIAALGAEREKLDHRVAQARGDAPSVAARAAALARLADGVAALAEASRAAAETALRLRDADEESARAAVTAGFPTLERATAVLLPREQREQIEGRLTRYRSELAAAEQQLAEPELAAAAALPPADLPGTQARLRSAVDRLRRAHAAQEAARERCTALATIGGQLAQLAGSLAPALGRFARINRLAAVAAGTSAENRLRMRLESYVLAARLEQVAAAASDRLVRMSGGRYTLVHSDDRGTGTKRSGLALRVVDAWTGTERDTSTLSGGESFFASLALALGLADVVTDEAGGMPLDTLFIDEGFGTLDEQTLEEVMDVLDGLRERDRAVGIVSHVADLKSRIPAQLLVRKGRHGSTLALAGREDA